MFFREWSLDKNHESFEDMDQFCSALSLVHKEYAQKGLVEITIVDLAKTQNAQLAVLLYRKGGRREGGKEGGRLGKGRKKKLISLTNYLWTWKCTWSGSKTEKQGEGPWKHPPRKELCCASQGQGLISSRHSLLVGLNYYTTLILINYVWVPINLMWIKW